MKASYAVLGGYGEMGQCIVRDLFETTRDEIWVAGHDAKKARAFAKSFKSERLKWQALDVSNTKALARFLKGKSICINATQYYWNLHVMKACLKAKTPYLDLGGLFHMTKKQLKLHRAFQKNGLTAVLGCGATPGITNIMAAFGASLLGRVHEIHVKFGGKDSTKYKPPFVLPYSAQTILDEFTMKAATYTNGRLRFIQPFSDEEKERFPPPISEVVCGSVLHSELATFPLSFKGLKECSFKGGFGEEFVAFIKMLVTQGFAEEPYRTWTVEFLNKFLPPPNVKVQDFEILRVTLIGVKNGKKKKLNVDCVAKSVERWNAPAGTVDTAVPPSIVAQMIVKGIIQRPGVTPPELSVPPLPFFRELRRRGIRIQISRS